MRIIDIGGNLITSYFIDKNNGVITNIQTEGEHLYIVTNKNHLVLFDILQQKKVGGYFNDFTYSEQDKLPDEKGLSAI